MATQSTHDIEGKHGNKGSTDEKNGSLPQKENGQSVDLEPYMVGVGMDAVPGRDQWSGKLDFVLACIGFAVGLGNVWRFPYLCYKNGGGAFLVPYFIFLVCGGVPIFFLEIALGQFMSQGGLGVWKICPIFQGIGWATTVIVFLLNIYYIVILAWAVYYGFMAFTSVLPWSHCNNEWNTYRCTISFGDKLQGCNITNLTSNINSTINGTWNKYSSAVNATTPSLMNFTLQQRCANATTRNFTPVDPVVEFWERKILQISEGVDRPDGLVWELAVALLLVWVLCYFCIWKGVKWTGKVVYFTATFPYAVLTVLLVRGLTLDGAREGIIFYLKPDFTKLSEAQVWIDAGTQIFFSYAIALGAMTALGSYNKFRNNCYRDCVVIAGVNSFTSLYSGFVIFSVLGFMAKQQQVDIQDVAESGPGLAFIAYPKAVTQMPVAPLWAVLFFFMILMLGLDSQFVGMEAFITVVVDLFPVLRKGWNREIFTAIYSGFSYLIGLTMVTRGGMYVFQLFDYYCASGMALLWVCFFEAIAVAWVYGARRFYDNIEMMVGYRINPWLRVCWTVLTPIITVSIFIFMWVQFKMLTYNRTYVYPWWAQGLGLAMAFSSMICIPAYFVVKMIITPGTLKQRWLLLTKPALQPHQIPSHWPEADKLMPKVQMVNGEKQPFLTEAIPFTTMPPAYEEAGVKQKPDYVIVATPPTLHASDV